MFTDEQDQLRHTVRSFLDKTSPEAEVRRMMITDDGYDPTLWKQMAAQLGLRACTFRNNSVVPVSDTSNSASSSRKWAPLCTARPSSQRRC